MSIGKVIKMICCLQTGAGLGSAMKKWPGCDARTGMKWSAAASANHGNWG